MIQAQFFKLRSFKLTNEIAFSISNDVLACRIFPPIEFPVKILKAKHPNRYGNQYNNKNRDDNFCHQGSP